MINPIKVVVVDGFSSGKLLAKQLHSDGCILFHVASSNTLDDYYYAGFDRSIYEKSVTHEEFEVTRLRVAEFCPDCIIAGAESGVLLADILNNALGLAYSNDFGKTTARRNKYEMIRLLAESGLSVAEQVSVDSWQMAEAWIKEKARFPVVIKPLDSAGADGVYICANVDQSRIAFNKIFGKKNRLNTDNTQILVQEYLAGTEYVVNMVSLNGQQLTTEVVRYRKLLLETGNIIYDVDEIIESTSDVYNSLVNYTRKAVLCLGIRNGPSHAEVMLTRSGPKLVEIAARTDGILRNTVCAQTTGLGQIKATAMSITDPASFERLTTHHTSYELSQNSYNVCLINRTDGIFKKDSFEQELIKLESFFEVIFYVENGQAVQATKDVFSQPGTVYLVHPDLQVIESDYQKIRAMEAEGIYLDDQN